MNATPLLEDADASSANCGTWLEDQDLYGKHLKALAVADRVACLQLCQKQPGCNAVTLKEYDDVCEMKAIPRSYSPVSHPGAATMRLCDSQLSSLPSDDQPAGAEAPLGALHPALICYAMLWWCAVGTVVPTAVSGAAVAGAAFRDPSVPVPRSADAHSHWG